MTAYYNENDPKAAAWLREPIKRNLIAPGEVDERSIEDIVPGELAGFTQCHFFAGIGVWCRDQKLRPVEPGTFPLAHGAPARAGRLRGYGNAIVAEAARAFIEACLEVECDHNALMALL